MSGSNSASSSAPPPTRFSSEERDLATITDPKKRRQIQNRIAQRVYRQKQKKRLQELEQQASSSKGRSEPATPSPPQATVLTPEQSEEYSSWTSLAMTYPFANAISERITGTQPEAPPDSPPALPSLNLGKRALGFHPISSAALEPKFIPIHLTPLPTAITTLLALLGTTPALYARDTATSPFGPGGTANLSLLHKRAPDLAPTPLQRSVLHHPYIDVIPFRGLRDNLLLALEDGALEEGELCRDIERGVRVWGGRVWDRRAWEWGKEFVEKWGWVLDDEAVEVANFWRAQRGEEGMEWIRREEGVDVGEEEIAMEE